MKTFTVSILVLFALSFSSISFSQEKEETAQQKSMAKMMAEHMDRIWNVTPDDDSGTIQLLMTKDGEPFSLPDSFFGNFTIIAKNRAQTQQSFNPNSNGRFVLEGLDPGNYSISITGLDDFSHYQWEFSDQQVDANEILTLNISLDSLEGTD